MHDNEPGLMHMVLATLSRLVAHQYSTNTMNTSDPAPKSPAPGIDDTLFVSRLFSDLSQP